MGLACDGFKGVRTFYWLIGWHILHEAVYIFSGLFVGVILKSWENCYVESAVLDNIFT